MLNRLNIVSQWVNYSIYSLCFELSEQNNVGLYLPPILPGSSYNLSCHSMVKLLSSTQPKAYQQKSCKTCLYTLYRCILCICNLCYYIRIDNYTACETVRVHCLWSSRVCTMCFTCNSTTMSFAGVKQHLLTCC